MVSLPVVQASNALISSILSPGLVAIFVGGTSGIGETTLKQFAKSTAGLSPHAYIIGRNEANAKRITTECQQLNPSGSYEFLKGDVSLIKVVDQLCERIKQKEKFVNVLFLSAGDAVLDRSLTSEGIHRFASLVFYSRHRFVTNLLPLIQAAPDLRRIVDCGCGTHEGKIYPEDFPALKLSLFAIRGHLCMLKTLALEAVANTAPGVSFITNFPGAVATPFSQHITGPIGVIMRLYFRLFGWLICVPVEECGERQLYFMTSARFPAKDGIGGSNGVLSRDGIEVANGTDGKIGSGVYSIGWDGESASPKVWKLLARYREEGMVIRVHQHAESEYDRVTR